VESCSLTSFLPLIGWCRRALSDILKVTLDFRDWNNCQRQGPPPGTGDWTLIYCGDCLDASAASFAGKKLACQGVQVMEGRRRVYRREYVSRSQGRKDVAAAVRPTLNRRQRPQDIDHGTRDLLLRASSQYSNRGAIRARQSAVSHRDARASRGRHIVRKHVNTKRVSFNFPSPQFMNGADSLPFLRGPTALGATATASRARGSALSERGAPSQVTKPG